jgi:hypothetical protein
MYVSCMKLEHNKGLWLLYPKVQFVCVECVYMANVSQHKNKTCGKKNTTQAQMRILHLIVQ